MTIKTTLLKNTANIVFVKLDKKSDLDLITNKFDCYQNVAIPDEALLDCVTINEDEEAVLVAVELFGENQWSEMSNGLVMFHP
jgi:hypothetical protein